MIEAGEDPRFLARRMVILASEDIGLADPQALLVAEAAARAVEYVGLARGGAEPGRGGDLPGPGAQVQRRRGGARPGPGRRALEREPGGPGPSARRPLQGCRQRSGTARATSTPMTTPPGWFRSSIVLTRSRDGCTTSPRPAEADGPGAGRPIREPGPAGRRRRWSRARSGLRSPWERWRRRRPRRGRRGGARRARPHPVDRAAAGGSDVASRLHAARVGPGRPGPRPRCGPGRAEPSRPGPGRGRRLDARVTRLPPLPDVGAIRGAVRAEPRRRWPRCPPRCAARG